MTVYSNNPEQQAAEYVKTYWGGKNYHDYEQQWGAELRTVADNVTVARLWEFELHLDTQEQTHIHEQHGRV